MCYVLCDLFVQDYVRVCVCDFGGKNMKNREKLLKERNGGNYLNVFIDNDC